MKSCNQKMYKALIFKCFIILLSIPGFSQVYLNEGFNGNSLPSNWSLTNQGQGACKWMIHAPFANATMLGSNFLYVDSDSAGSGTVANEIFTSPVINVSPGTVTFLEFQHHYRAGGILRLDTGSVEVYNGTAWVRAAAYFVTQGSGSAPASVKINLTAHANPALQIRFRYVGNWAYYWAIDNVKIYTPSATDVGVTNIRRLNSKCGIPSSFSVSVKVNNFGSQEQSNIPLSYQVNGGTPVSASLPGPLAPGDSTNFTFSVPFAPTTPGNYSFSAWTSLVGDQDATNDSTKNKTGTYKPSGFDVVTFSGFDGSNLSSQFPGWLEATGLTPSENTAGWINSPQAQVIGLGSVTAKINLFSNTKKDWIIGPPINPLAGSVLRYNIALTNWNTAEIDSMGSDDSLMVKVSTNCGQTWTKIRTYTKANQPTNQFLTEIIPLAPYAGQTILIGFYATEGSVDDPNDYDMHIDDPVVFVQSPDDLAMVSILNTNGECGVGNSLSLQVRVFNNGTQPQTNIPLKYSIDGQTPVSQVFAQTLAPGATADFTFSDPVSFSSSGNHLISAWSELANDQNLQNDSVKNALFIKPNAGFNAIEFNGFTGANLATIYPGWKESTGLNPTVNTSSWTNSNASQTTALGSATARINLFGNSKKDWIISQPIIPTTGTAVRFKLAVTNFASGATDVMGADDSLVVKITTNCGQTWTTVRSITAADNLSNSLTTFMISLDSYAGQNIRVGFMATEGVVDNPQDYDLHLDAIEVYVPSPNDLNLVSLVLPDASCGAGSSLVVKVRVANNGTVTQNSIPVSYSFNGQAAVSETFTQSLVSGQIAEFSFTNPVILPTAGNYSISAWTALNGDQNTQNDSVKNVSISRPGNSFNLVTFTGFTGTNLTTTFPGWEEAAGLIASGTTSAWTNSLTAQTNALGSTTARVNLYTNTRKEWLISPAFVPTAGYVFRMKIATTAFGGTGNTAMGTDDSLIVKISTNCGQSWTNERFWTSASSLTNQLVSYSVPLSAYAGQNILIGIYATDGPVDNPQDYDLHVDDLEIMLPLANDVSVSDIIFPAGNCGAPASLNMTIKVSNLGSDPQSNIPVFYNMNGQTPVSETIAGPLAPGTSVNFTFSQVLDLSAPGNYVFNAWSALANDGNAVNDSIKNRVLVRPGPEVSIQDFTSFNGSNLETVSPGWYEATGQIPVANASTWVNSTGSQTTALGTQTARINMNGNTKRDWIISPVFSPVAETNLAFRIALTNRNFALASTMGSDDSVNVMVTTNCGTSWVRLRAFVKTDNLSNQLTSFTIPLGSYVGTPLRIGFFATEGTVNDPEDFDFHLDDILISTTTATKPQLVQGQIRIFPNPATGSAKISWEGIAHKAGDSFQLYSLEGKAISPAIELSAQQNGQEISLANQSPGIYVVKIQMDGNQYFERLIVQ